MSKAKTASVLRFRAPGARIEHFTADSVTTFCGLNARYGAKFGGPGQPAGTDIKPRPLCGKCRNARTNPNDN